MDQPIRLLLVLADYGDARQIQDLLRENSSGCFDFFYAGQLAVALTYLTPGSIDVVLLDPSLPDVHGLEAYQGLRAQAPDVPVILMTGPGHEAVAREAMQQGAQDFLVKGQVDGPQLERALRHAIERTKILGQLRHSQDSLQATKDQLEDTLQKLYSELETARKVQESLLPRSLDGVEGVRLAAYYMASEYIGGDLYDVVPLDRHRTAFLVFDVTGHGVTSALLSAMAKICFRRYMDLTHSPRAIFQQVNREVVNFLPEDRFITAFLGVLDRELGVFSFVRASHPPALLVRRAAGTVESLESKGYLLGLFPDKEYEEEKVSVAGGDKIFIYTDGLTEVFNEKRELFDKHRLKQILQETAALPIQATVDQVVRETREYSGHAPPVDDITVLGVEVL